MSCLFAALSATSTTPSSFAADNCSNAAIREARHAGSLPDCRAYEQVSPVDKNGLDVSGVNVGGGFVQVAPGGDSVSYGAPGAFPGAESAGVANAYVARRNPAGWATAGSSPPLDPHVNLFGFTAPVYGYNRALTKAAVVTNTALTPGLTTRPDLFNLFVRDLTDGSYTLVTTVPDPDPAPLFATFARYTGASADFTHVIFEDTANLTPEATGNTTKLYEWEDGSPAQLRLVSTGFSGGAAGSGGPQDPSFGVSDAIGSLDHAISEDGRRIFFTTPPGTSTAVSTGQIYLRQDGTSTTQVTASERTDPSGDPAPDPGGTQPATFWSATPDGSSVLFTSAEQLTNDDHNSGGDDLYRYDVDGPAGHRLTRLSAVDGDPTSTVATNVQGVVGASRDGVSYVYFVAAGQLVPNKGTADLSNLYVYHNGSVDYIATFDSAYTNDGLASIASFVTSKYRVVTPDGRHLAFVAQGPVAACGEPDAPVACPHGGHRGVYVYDAAAQRLRCASCPSDGSVPTGDAQFAPIVGGAVGFLSTLTKASNLTDDGERLFFNSDAALVPEDTNGKTDVYEWQDGAAHLISPGTGAGSFNFVAADSDGNNVFFETIERLVDKDQDDLFDLYDARVGGGSPEPPSAQEPCAGDACQGASSPPPPLTEAASVSFVGSGNPTARPDAPASPASKPKVTKPKAVTGASASLTIKIPSRGALTVSGTGLKTVRKSTRAATYHVQVSLTPLARRTLKKKKRYTTTARVVFKVDGGGTSTSRITLTFKASSAKEGR